MKLANARKMVYQWVYANCIPRARSDAMRLLMSGYIDKIKARKGYNVGLARISLEFRTL